MEKNPGTRIDIEKGGLRQVDDEVESRFINRMDPPSSEPSVGNRLRYSLSHKLLGRLESIAEGRWELGQLVAEQNITVDSVMSLENIAQSVQASSRIEGEEIDVQRLDLYLAAVTSAGGFKNLELSNREKAFDDINKTYRWALFSKTNPILTSEFILELHRRMFESTYGEHAGVFKSEEIFVRGGGYDVTTLPCSRVPEFVDRLCERVNKQIKGADDYSEYSTILTIAEFIVDFLAIHPFRDGNGRLARLLSTYLLERCGYHFARFYPLDNIIFETRSEYYQALFKGQTGWYTESEDLSAWVNYYIKAVFTQWLRAFQRARDKYDVEGLTRAG